MNQYGAGTRFTPEVSNNGEKGLSEEIMELNELYKQGILSEEEYEAAKRKALGL